LHKSTIILSSQLKTQKERERERERERKRERDDTNLALWEEKENKDLAGKEAPTGSSTPRKIQP